MAQMKRSQAARAYNFSQLVLGICLGGLFMFLYIGPSYEATIPTSNTKLRALEQTGTKDEDGWHPINVYYGDKAGLKAPADQKWFGQVRQDEILVDLIGENGYFIDLAANDALELTNTLALERHGWKGLCIEPNPAYWYGLSHRSCTVVGALMGGSKQKIDVQFRGVYGGIVDKMDTKLANRKKEPKAATEERYTAPIREMLTKFQVPKSIDYLSLDVEGAELLIMKEFPFDDYKIKIMTVERPDEELRALLESKGYRFLKDLSWWGETLWAHESMGLTPDHPKIKKIKTEERD
jgi:hypothetical protein